MCRKSRNGRLQKSRTAAVSYTHLDVYKRQVPNHLTEQWGAEFLQLYPGANILVATKKDVYKRQD